MALSLTVAVCLVVGISDGDTVTVRCGNSPAQKVRLSQIDAPEKRQPFGERAKQHLSGLVFKQQVELTDGGRDRYGRTLGSISLKGESINWLMVRDGFAWCYRRYLVDKACLSIEQEARDGRRGLWQDANPIEPWVWRRR